MSSASLRIQVWTSCSARTKIGRLLGVVMVKILKMGGAGLFRIRDYFVACGISCLINPINSLLQLILESQDGKIGKSVAFLWKLFYGISSSY